MPAKRNKKSQDLTRFLTSEEGKIVKGDVVKMAALLGIIGAAVQPADAQYTHSNNIHNAGSAGAYHSSGHGSHSSHGSHGSHGQW